MSKAFTKEGDDPDVVPDPRGEARTLPPGVPNYVTRAGYDRLRALGRRLDAAVVVEPRDPGAAPSTVAFGSRVTVAQDGRPRTYTIVGVDEVDEKAGQVSWLSPIGRALTGAAVGDVVSVERPGRELELEVLAIA
ncbi:MAG: GreA/GreB family elongation factor [Myxococcota bacterium]